MDKAWRHLPRVTREFQEGALKFVNNAVKYNEQLRNSNLTNEDSTDDQLFRYISCPCSKCQNLGIHLKGQQVFDHLVCNGMDPTYTNWVLHGEPSSISESRHENIEISDTYRMYVDALDNDNLNHENGIRQDYMPKDAELPLYPGCTKSTKLSATLALYKIKTMNGLSTKSFNELLKTINDYIIPDENLLPKNNYETKKLLKAFNLNYEKIHACVNDCCLFRKELADLDACPKCKTSRYKKNSNQNDNTKKVPMKVLRYFPIIPRLKRMFKSQEIAEQLRWHNTNRSTDGKIRHPVDSLAWKTVDKKWPSFASDARNLRFGLATDGFNPFSDLSSTYSCWPVMLAMYNLPPWLCMKKEYLLLSLLIPGPKQPGNDIDIYLEPLIDDLKDLWENGLEIYDAFSKSMFKLNAILMWTINDFPAYGNLAGCTTKGKKACPICGIDTLSDWLPFSCKCVYMHHRRFLSPNHAYRKKKSWFDGNNEERCKPKIISGVEVLNAMTNILNDWGKNEKKEKRKNRNKKKKPQREDTNDTISRIWKKRSIFFQLPYWKDLLLRHNLDVMHVEKNVCESIMGTILNIKGKSKDGLNSRKDLQHMGIRTELHPQEMNGKIYLPPSQINLPKQEMQIFYKRLRNLKVPDGYSSNIRRCFSKDNKIIGLKSHDCHVLMQQLLSVALRGLLPKGPRTAIFQYCAFFNEICQRVIDQKRLEDLENEITETLCLLERYFPPSFFDIMIHLTIHLVRELRLCGPVQYRWMYPFERYMKVLKGYVKNPARPEGCIAERYITEESMRYCSDYIEQAAEIGVRYSRNEGFQNDSPHVGRPISKRTHVTLSNEMLKSAHRYVLFNTKEVEHYEKMHMDELKHLDNHLTTNQTVLWNKHSDEFSDWFREKVQSQINMGIQVSDTIKWLSYEPIKRAVTYTGYIINECRFHVKDVQRSTQNSGVSIEANNMNDSHSLHSNNNVQSAKSYYGVLREIIVLDYSVLQVPVFKCDWVNINRGIKVEDGFTLVNLHQFQNQFLNDPFIMASQAKQVFYSRESPTSNWYVVIKPPPKGFHELELYDEATEINRQPFYVSKLDEVMDDDDAFVRSDCEGTYLCGCGRR